MGLASLIISVGIGLQGGRSLPGTWPWNDSFWGSQARERRSGSGLVRLQIPTMLPAESFALLQNWLSQGGAVSPQPDGVFRMSKHHNTQRIKNMIPTTQHSSAGRLVML